MSDDTKTSNTDEDTGGGGCTPITLVAPSVSGLTVTFTATVDSVTPCGNGSGACQPTVAVYPPPSREDPVVGKPPWPIGVPPSPWVLVTPTTAPNGPSWTITYTAPGHGTFYAYAATCNWDNRSPAMTTFTV